MDETRVTSFKSKVKDFIVRAWKGFDLVDELD